MHPNEPSLSINLAEYFQDEDDEALLYYVKTDNTNTVIEAAILGSELLLEPLQLGKSTVNVWTVDGLGERADIHFNVTVEAVTEAERNAFVSSLQNHPNPFIDNTTITYHLKRNGHVQLVVQDVTGRIMETLIDEDQLPGEKQLEYGGSSIQSGLYFYHLFVNGKSLGVRKMIKH